MDPATPRPTGSHRLQSRHRGLACKPCQKRKLRCDHNSPCGNCLRSRNEVCTYDARRRQGRESQKPPEITITAGGLDKRDSGPVRTVPSDAAREGLPPTKAKETAMDRGKWYSSTVASFLVQNPVDPSAAGLAEGTGREIEAEADDPQLPYTAGSSGAPKPYIFRVLKRPIKSAMVNCTYFAPSSWLYSTMLVPDVLSWYDRFQQEKSNSWHDLQLCKSLARQLHEKNSIKWLAGEYGAFLPPKNIADLLIDNYIQTFQGIYQVLHIPSFKQHYENLWISPGQKSKDVIVQVQLCLALGACTYDDNFPWRSKTLQWITEAGTWLESTDIISIAVIQNMCLLSLAKKSIQELYGSSLWVRSGSLKRSAIAIGLHRDPDKLPGISSAQAEIRRRLWATVLELVLDSCLDAGAPPLLSVEEYDCPIPKGLEDSQISLAETYSDIDVQPSSDRDQIDSSLFIAFARSFPARLAIATYVNSPRSETVYQEILSLSSALDRVRYDFELTVRKFGSRVKSFQHHYYDMLFSRYTFTLHIPFHALALANPLYTFSRTTCVEAALRLCHAAMYPAITVGSIIPTFVRDASRLIDTNENGEYARLMLCGSGTYRAVQFQTFMIIAAELITSLGGWSSADGVEYARRLQSIRDHELMGFIRMAYQWSKHRIMLGQNNIKDFMFIAALLAGINAVVDGSKTSEAMDEKVREACVEAKSRLSNDLNMGRSESENLTQPSEMTWDCDSSDFWTMDLRDGEDFTVMMSQICEDTRWVDTT